MKPETKELLEQDEASPISEIKASVFQTQNLVWEGKGLPQRGKDTSAHESLLLWGSCGVATGPNSGPWNIKESDDCHLQAGT